MIRSLLIILMIGLFSSNTKGQDNFSITIRIPKNSGWAFVDYHIYKIADNNLYVLDNIWDLKTRRDTVLESYPIKKKDLQKLKVIISKIDSIGWQTNYCTTDIMGWPRFFIDIVENGKTKSGTIANVYRKNIFDIIDIFNEIYPKGTIIRYNKSALLKAERGCKKS